MRFALHKLRARLDDEVAYTLAAGDTDLALNALLGEPLAIVASGRIFCDACGRQTPKSYAQGHCYPCMRRLARCDLCVLKPETCHYAAGTCREPAWGETHCMTGHIVYLANTSALKVGITRANQVPTRWLDQGATQALPLFRTSTRHVAGLVEVAIARRVADKTNWRAMLRGDGAPLDLAAAGTAAASATADELDLIRAAHGVDAIETLAVEPLAIRYPVRRYPQKLATLNLDKTPRAGGVLEGIKGQYLLFDTGVLNVRKFTGYEVAIETG